MKSSEFSSRSAAPTNAPAPTDAVAGLVTGLTSTDSAERGRAWHNAATAGAAALGPLAELMTSPGFETARAARRAIEQIVRHAGRPGAEKDRRAVEDGLLLLLSHAQAVVRRHALWMLSEIGQAGAIAPMARLLTDPQAREDARCALLRMPGAGVTKALQQALRTAPEEFRYALADALRARGVKVSGYPSRKLVPVR